MKDLRKVSSEDAKALIKPGRFYSAKPEVALVPNDQPVLVKAQSQPGCRGVFSCTVLGQDRSGEVTVQKNRGCQVGSILEWLSDEEAAVRARTMLASESAQTSFLDIG